MTDIRIYVACLSAYNSGMLHGVWIDLDPKAFHKDDIQEQIDAMLKSSPVPGAEEWGIHDTEGLPFKGEPSLDEVLNYCELVAQHGQDLVDAALEYQQIEFIDDSIDCFRGCYSSAKDYCQEMLEESIACHVPRHDKQLTSLVSDLFGLVDWDHAVREAECNSVTFVKHNDEVYVFGG